jgi:hypothetical protein
MACSLSAGGPRLAKVSNAACTSMQPALGHVAPRYGNWNSVFVTPRLNAASFSFTRWSKLGVAPVRRTQRIPLTVSRGGFSTKIHLRTNAKGYPLTFDDLTDAEWRILKPAAPRSGRTWSTDPGQARDSRKVSRTAAGRGAQPVWLREQLKAGAKLEDFAVNRSVATRKASAKKTKEAPGQTLKITR